MYNLPNKELKTLVVGQDVDKTDGKVKVAYLGGLENLKVAPTDGKLTFKAAAVKGEDDNATADVSV